MAGQDDLGGGGSASRRHRRRNRARRRALDLGTAIERFHSEVNRLEGTTLAADEYQELTALITDLARLLVEIHDDLT